MLRSLAIDDTLIWQKIEDIVIKSIIAGEHLIFKGCKDSVPFRNNCFQLFGFDILIDNCLKPWLLEINLSPSLGCESPLDTRIKENLIADLLTLICIVPNDKRFGTD